jgi:hypothetical protein
MLAIPARSHRSTTGAAPMALPFIDAPVPLSLARGSSPQCRSARTLISLAGRCCYKLFAFVLVACALPQRDGLAQR